MKISVKKSYISIYFTEYFKKSIVLGKIYEDIKFLGKNTPYIYYGQHLSLYYYNFSRKVLVSYLEHCYTTQEKIMKTIIQKYQTYGYIIYIMDFIKLNNIIKMNQYIHIYSPITDDDSLKELENDISFYNEFGKLLHQLKVFITHPI